MRVEYDGLGSVPGQVHDAARVAPHVVVPAHTFTMVVPSVIPAMGSKVKEVGLILKSVEAIVRQRARGAFHITLRAAFHLCASTKWSLSRS